MAGLLRFAPPIAWMGVIAVVSSDSFSTQQTGAWLLPLLEALLPRAGPDLLFGIHAVLRKLGHLVEYGILAVLWVRALAPGRAPRRAALGAIGLAALYAVVDEARQGFTAYRSPAAMDVGIDTAGAFLAVAWLHGPAGFALAAARCARWVALLVAAGSLAAAALDWRLGLPAWDLVIAAVGALIVAWILRRLERAGATPPDRGH